MLRDSPYALASAVARSGQGLLSLLGEDADKIGCGRQVRDQIDCLAGPYRQRRQLCPRHLILIGLQSRRIRGELVFPPPPSVEVRMAERTGRVPGRPRRSTGDIQDRAALGVLSASLDDCLLD